MELKTTLFSYIQRNVGQMEKNILKEVHKEIISEQKDDLSMISFDREIFESNIEDNANKKSIFQKAKTFLFSQLEIFEH